MMLGVEDDNRFGFLLKPIRDLTKNWDVDIAGHLEEYLEELENVAITFDGGRTMNFAEAALLIQGSTCVYSRKVEYLYVLVYEVLDLLVSKKRNKQDNAGKNNEDGDPDVTFDDEDNQLLPLDDIKELEIVMKEDEKLVGTIPRRPMSMIPFGEEMGDDQLLSKNGEVLGRRKDFRLNTSKVNRDSSLLLEVSAQLLSGLLPKDQESQKTTLTNNDGTPIEIQVNDDLMDADCQNFDDDDDKGADDHFEDDCKDSSVLPVEEEKVDEGVKRSERIRGMMLQDKDKFSSVPTKMNPWHEQDPFEPKKMTDKAFKKCKTFRIPNCLNENKSKKRKRVPEEKKMDDMVLIGEFIASTLFSYKQKIPKVLQESCLPEFEKSCWLKLSERQAKKKIEINAMETILEQQILESENHQEENVDIVAGGVCGDGDDNDEDEDVGLVLNWQDDLFNDEVEPIVNDDRENDEPATSYEQLVQKHIEAFYDGAQKYAQITELSKKIAEWEARIIPKLKEEETCEPFDIHVYGIKVLNCTPKGSNISLAKLMAGKAPREIGRLFLSTLMLANAGNLEISCPGVLEEGMDKAEVKLLRTKLHFEELETYVAPSLANKDKEN